MYSLWQADGQHELLKQSRYACTGGISETAGMKTIRTKGILT